MQDANSEDATAREFRLAVQALAAEPDAQVAALSPGCISCELGSDFDTYHRLYLDTLEESLTTLQRAQIQELCDALQTIPDEDWECFNNDVLTRKSWQTVRVRARRLLEAMHWPFEPPPGFDEIATGVWYRP